MYDYNLTYENRLIELNLYSIQKEETESIAKRRAKIQGGCRGPAKIQQKGGGVAINFYFLRDKNITFESFYAMQLKKDYFLEFYVIKRSTFRIS